jgi:SAM-dependent methyltransferase
MTNIDQNVVDDFGSEWGKYDQSELLNDELEGAFDQYFSIFPFDELEGKSVGFDMGCGSGRWAKLVAGKVGHLNCVEPSSEALAVAKRNLSDFSNVEFFNASVSEGALEEGSQDFGYCLGVLHHIPDTLAGIKSCGKLLKKDAPFLLYLYYNFENRSPLFKFIWRMSDALRRVTSVLPNRLKFLVTRLLAVIIYLPLARLSYVLEKMGMNVSNIPLSDYRNKSYYFMRTDALDRFGTKLEKRFSRAEITAMLDEAGFDRVQFSDKMPHWVCVARKT